jgi:uncharacterized lipoprotein YmbA
VFVLDAPLQSAAQPTQLPDGPTLQVQSVTLPDYLDTEDILMRDSAHELKASASGKWGERLSAGMTQALAAALVSRLPAYQLKPPRPTDRLARQILVDVDAFDVWPDGRCALSASWTILQPGATAVAPNRREVFLTPSIKASAAGDATVVAAMAATIDQLADAIAHDLATPAALVSSEHP